MDGASSIKGGWLNRHYIQLGYQLAGCVSILAYAFTVTAVLLFVMDRIPGLKLRISEEAEHSGLDDFEIGEAIMEYGITEVLEAGVRQIKADNKQSTNTSEEKVGST